MKVAIIGCGLIGRKRATFLPKGMELATVCDVNETAGVALANNFNCRFEKKWQTVANDSAIQAVFIATTNNYLTPIGEACILKGKHVLIEKPGARNPEEFQRLIDAHQKSPVVVRFGFNHRYHPSLLKAKEIVASEVFGPVMFIRAKYGHGARLGYGKEWRFNPAIAGGGELLDQGSHLIDLTNYFIGEMDEVMGMTGKLFWSEKLEDSACITMRNRKGQLVQLSATCIEWKNVFQFEIMCKTAKIQINGLGMSYGKETIILYKMKPEMGPPDVEEIDFEQEDHSWQLENEEFSRAIEKKDYSDKKLREAKYCIDTVFKVYQLNQKQP
ncbi:Gfo/Idh/MocA family oxidoreductase [Candidatus Peregrinibacteria bacterium]|nr:Gfo/Idh/MocA family oxidoreductase [Candidatus Peregrinibacteria bacterium]